MTNGTHLKQSKPKKKINMLATKEKLTVTDRTVSFPIVKSRINSNE